MPEIRNGKVIRLFYVMLDLIDPDGKTLEELATTYGVSTKTAGRDIDALCKASVPVVRLPEKRYRIEVSEGITFPNLQLSPSESFLFLLSLQLAQRTALPRDREDFEVLKRKAAVILPLEALRLAEKLANLYVPLNQPEFEGDQDGDDLRFLEDAVTTEGQWVRFDYTKRTGEAQSYTAAPHALVTSYGRVYLLAHKEDQVTQDPRLFAVSRIRNVELLEDEQTPATPFPEPVDPQVLAQRNFGLWDEEPLDVEILFAPEVADTLQQNRFHPSQQVEPQPDGRLRLTLHCGGYNEIKWWVLKFGQQAEVIQPASLREDITNTLQAALANYQA